jgi:ribosomal protein S18 acetylase RimI-like enzyme
MFEPITDADVPAIAALMNRAYRGTGPLASWCSEAPFIAGDRTSPELLRSELSARPNAIFLKWPDSSGTILGCVLLEPLADGEWHLGSLATDPARQQSGLGRALLAAAEDWVQARGGFRVRMTVVNVKDTLIAWYLRRGYAVTGETEPFPYGDNRFGTPLRDDLNFVVLARTLASGP